MNKRLKAVTVIELAIALLISAIVIAIAYNSMDVFNRMYSRFLLKNDINHQLIVFDKIIKSDLQRSEVVLRKGNGISLHKSGSEWINYEWMESYILRHKRNINTDTFYVKSVFLQSGFNGLPREENNSVIDEIIIAIIKESESMEAIYFKPYGADVYMNYSENINN
jgi:type II secretory pathway component PulJ